MEISALAGEKIIATKETLAVPERNYLYRTLRGLFRLSTKVYFRKIYIHNRQAIPKNVPLILVSNHPSAFMDPILLGSIVPQECIFLARGEAFNKKFGNLMMLKMNALPVYREDISPEKVHLNRDTFRKSFALLDHGKTLFYFPEGVSQTEPRLRPLKKGLARLAFNHAEENNWQQELCLLPVGLSYTDPHSFRSNVNVQFGEPLYLSTWKNAYLENKAKTLNALTEACRIQLENSTVFIPRKEDEKISRLAEDLLGFWKDNINKTTLQKLNLINKAIHKLNLENPAEAVKLKEQADEYFELLSKNGFEDSDFHNTKSNFMVETGKLVLGGLIGLPLFLYGVLNHFLPYCVAGFATKKMTPRQDFTGSLRLAAGTFGTVIFYILQTLGVGFITGSAFWALIYILTLAPSGIFAMYYAEWIAKTSRRAYMHLKKNTLAFDKVRKLRQNLTAKILLII
ncbi:MAG: hypothetical protein EOP53_07425 [Sphingobacteriales bacterium]|nr:MAG: hypothetical protein EOP53_07425 [Sphingobacteriales bacterium]